MTNEQIIFHHLDEKFIYHVREESLVILMVILDKQFFNDYVPLLQLKYIF